MKICHFCNLSIQDLECQNCSTEDVKVIMYSLLYVHLYYDKYEAEIDLHRRSTSFYRVVPYSYNSYTNCTYSFISTIDAIPITPSNIKDKLLTYVLLS